MSILPFHPFRRDQRSPEVRRLAAQVAEHEATISCLLRQLTIAESRAARAEARVDVFTGRTPTQPTEGNISRRPAGSWATLDATQSLGLPRRGSR